MSKRRMLWLIVVSAGVVLCTGLAWSFKERSSVIPSQGGVVVTMPAILTAHYRQRDARWNDEPIGGSGETMGRVGCTTTAKFTQLES